MRFARLGATTKKRAEMSALCHFGRTASRPAPWRWQMYSTIAPDSARSLSPSSMTGAVAAGCRARNSGGASRSGPRFDALSVQHHRGAARCRAECYDRPMPPATPRGTRTDLCIPSRGAHRQWLMTTLNPQPNKAIAPSDNTRMATFRDGLIRTSAARITSDHKTTNLASAPNMTLPPPRIA
jgi:hypothetical protein